MIGIDAYETIAVALYESHARATTTSKLPAYIALPRSTRKWWRQKARAILEEASEDRVQTERDSQEMYEILNPPL